VRRARAPWPRGRARRRRRDPWPLWRWWKVGGGGRSGGREWCCRWLKGRQVRACAVFRWGVQAYGSSPT
jgi:hypothetical protein